MSMLHPLPAYAVNAPISELQTAELLIVTSLRLWATQRSKHDGRHPDWRGGLVAARLEAEQIRAFDVLLCMIAAALRRRPDVRPSHCRHLGMDEGMLLQCIGLLQRGQIGAAAQVLALWLPPTALRLAIPPAMTVATALEQSGLKVPVRHAEAATMHAVTAHGHADRGLYLVH
ncbi:MAG TPA: hypothetical protein VF342_16305 [Alphaproteobacteria bacterium]